MGYSVAVYSFYTGSYMWLFVNSLVNAGFQIPAVPLTINFASEITFPQEASVITGFLLMSARFAGFFLALITSVICEYLGSPQAMVFLVACNLVAVVCGIILKEDLKKFKFS